MALRTAFTTRLSITHPIALAPMGDVAGGRLAAAVSNGGGLGLVGGGRGEDAWVDRELAIAARSTDAPWGVGFLAWAVTASTVERALAHGPHAVFLSFGDPGHLTQPIRKAEVPLIIQVTSLEEARRAVDLGADFIVAQGSEAGGHGGGRATLPFVPAVVDLAAPIPVLAAGGIADGRGLAAALVLGAAGAVIGTRFEATPEALISPDALQQILARGGEDTERSVVLDVARDAPWPPKYPARTLRNAFLETWRDRVDELRARPEVRATYRGAVDRGDRSAVPVWAGEGIDLVTSVTSARDLVADLSAQAADVLSITLAATTEVGAPEERSADRRRGDPSEAPAGKG